MKYFLVLAKCGHVGRNKFFKGTFFIRAENGREAARVVRSMPRVKHDHKDAIISVTGIGLDDYLAGVQAVHDTPYFTCLSKQEQNLIFEEIQGNIFDDEVCHKSRYNKRHSLKKVYNADPDYDLYCKCKNSVLIS